MTASLASVPQPLSPPIHLIDGDAAVRASLALLIGTAGLRVQTWGDLQAFLTGFDRQSVVVIVLEMRMPGISGLTVLEALVAQGVDQPVIMPTGHGTVQMCRRSRRGRRTGRASGRAVCGGRD